MANLKWLFIAGITAYAAFCALMFFAQRALMYFPERVRTAPAAAGLPQAQEVMLDTADGEKIIAWHVPPRGDKPVVIYFHGNGGSLRLRVDRFARLVADGVGLLAVSYRGYGGSSGSPSEVGLIEDARAAYVFAAQRYPGRIVAWGESLGSGVAIALAAEKPVSKLILDAPFTSALDIAASAYPFLPVRLLMKDQFRSDLRIAQVKAPVLILHGDADSVVPIEYGERLLAMIPGKKQMVRFAGGEHVDLDRHGATDAVLKFLAGPLD
ncbi:MAG: alpha/beta fold hydrolase [Xanthobacteraceae bacterium]